MPPFLWPTAFLWPWMFLLLPLPFLLRWILPESLPSRPSLKVPFFHQLSPYRQGLSLNLSWLFVILGWICLVTAAARPIYLGEPVPLKKQGRELVLIVDLSGSMQEHDLLLDGRPVSRLEVVKALVSDFISRRTGDRIGLLLFGTRAFFQVPLTDDHRTVTAWLREAEVGMAGEATAIGDAVGLAVKRLRDKDGERVVILLTDGANTAGVLDPPRAADMAQQIGLRIHTIGVAGNVRSPWGRGNPSSDIDEPSLQQIATTTGGQYFRARTTDDLARIYARLDEIEPIEREQARYRPQTELYYWPLLGALCLGYLLGLGRVLTA